MLTSTSRTKLADFIGAVASNERLLETKRQLLADEPLFSPYLAFTRMDRLHAGYLTPYDIKDYLRDCGIFVTISEAEGLVKLFGDSIRSRLYKEDFFDMILPADSLLRLKVLDRDKYSYPPLSRSVEVTIARLLQTIIDGNNRAAGYLSTLKSIYSYNNYDAFHEIDTYRTGYISFTDLSVFLKQTYIGSFSDAELFIRHFDRNKDGKLSYTEFNDGLEAIEKKEIYSKFSYSEKKPSLYKSRYESPAPRSEYKGSIRRFGSEERTHADRLRSSYISPSKSLYESPYKKTLTDFSPSKSLYDSFVVETKSQYLPTKLEFEKTMSPVKQREVSRELSLAMEEQLGYERRFEKAKQELALRFDFNLVDAFKVFDWTDKGYVTMPEFYDGMKDLGVAASYSEISQLFKRLSSNLDGKVRYSNFRALFTPKVREYELMMLGRKPYSSTYLSRPSLIFTSQTSYLYRNAIEIALSHERAIELIRQRLKRNVLFNSYNAFDVIDTQGKGYFSLWEVTFFISKLVKRLFTPE